MSETPKQVEARRNMFSRFARLQAIAEENRRPKMDLLGPRKLPGQEHSEVWRSEQGQADYDRKNMDYVRKYTTECKIDSGSGKPRDILVPKDTNDDQKSVISTDSTLTDGTRAAADVQHQLDQPKPRSKAHVRKCLSEAKSNADKALDVVKVNGFVQASTIVTPSEVVSSEFVSNVSCKDIKERYFKKYEATKSLPIYAQRGDIIDAVNTYSVVIIEGRTGCGKTTQVPMYILEDAILERPSETGAPVIYVTQPRRIAARTLAERVCTEHGWTVPSVVGYQVSLEKEIGPETILVFCTAGVLLQKIIQEKSLKNYTHIIIDEVHERDADTDLLMMMIRKLMLTEMCLFKLIIMSATMDINKLFRYFTFKTNFGSSLETRPGVVAIGDKSRKPTNIQYIYLDMMRTVFNLKGSMPDFELENPELHDDSLNAAVKIVVDIVPRLDNFNESSKSTLIFLPGMAEISRLDQMIKKNENAKDHLDIIPLHSCLTVADQLKVFKPPRPGCRKIILATNIAESSITVQDVGFIIDFCLTKTLLKDPVTRFPTLKLFWSTQDKCEQRAGRTGRCCPGKVFRLVPHKFYEQFDEYAVPEILTSPLELSVLRVKNFQMGEIQALFAILMDPPPEPEIRTAVLELKQIGALSATYKGHLSDTDGDLTELGRIISALPIDVHLSKLIVVASVFDVLDDAIIVAACLSTNRSVVRFLYGNTVESYEIKLDWARGSQSDLFVSLDCYKEFHELKAERGKTGSWLASWCARNCLDERKLHDVDALVNELKQRLERVNIFSGIERPNQVRDVDMDNLMLKIAFCAAFYPNYFLTEDLDSERITKELCGTMDPLKTVVMSGFPVNQVPLYKTQVAKQLQRVCEDYDFISDVSRAYLVMKDEDEMSHEGFQRVANALEEDKYQVIQHSRTVPKVVYKAIKHGETAEIQLREFKEAVASERMEWYSKQRQDLAKQLPKRLIPPCMKVLEEGQTADNTRLLDADENEYAEITGQCPYYEVELDVDQDMADYYELEKLELHESKQRVVCPLNHPIYKAAYKRVRGPDSPIRMSFRSVLVKSSGYVADIDSQSVNSILLDPEYKDSRRQMLVAAAVVQSKRNRVSARDTTLMPNIRGLPTLMALLFAQYYRLIYNKELKCIAGAVFGIGWTKKDDLPLDRQYEVDLGFDVHITVNDILLINRARSMMSELLKFTEIQNAGKPQAALQSELRKIILALIRKRRYPLSELDISMASVNLDENIFIKEIHNLQEDIIEEGSTRPFLPLMRYTVYSEIQMYDAIRQNLDQLTRIERDDEPVPLGGIKCLVCGNGQKCCFILALNVENHLRTEIHKKKVAEFEVYEKRVRQAQ